MIFFEVLQNSNEDKPMLYLSQYIIAVKELFLNFAFRLINHSLYAACISLNHRSLICNAVLLITAAMKFDILYQMISVVCILQ